MEQEEIDRGKNKARQDETKRDKLETKEVKQRNLNRNQNGKQVNQTGEQSRQVRLISRLEYSLLLYIFKYYGLLNTTKWHGGSVRAPGLVVAVVWSKAVPGVG